ncbi:DUF3592 domain-containing protein [Candidatus Saccharibacteria bacterium]|nr:DUF3592 domain-containing protein [Candidatus Saccharibacteria bacterium]
MKLFNNVKKQATGFLDQYKQRDPASYAAAQQAVGGLLILDGFIGIDNPFAGKKRAGIFGTLGMMVFGLIFMLSPHFINSMTGMDKMTAQTSAQVTSVGAPRTSTDSDGNTSTTCNFTAKYSVDGKEYQSPSSSSSSGSCQLTAGQTVEINYNPANPSQWMSDRQTWTIILSIFFYVGLFILLSGIVTFTIRFVSIIFGWKILRSGRALAKTLPAGPDLGAMVSAIKNDFTKSLFGFNSPSATAPIIESIVAPVPVAPVVSPAPQPVEPATPVAPVPPVAPQSQEDKPLQ